MSNYFVHFFVFITFCVRQPKRNVYWPWLSMCLSVYISLAAFPHYWLEPDLTWGNDRGWRVVVHYWADLQSKLKCHRVLVIEMSSSACTCSVPGFVL